VWHAFHARGIEYVCHKVLRRTLGRYPNWKRRWVYADARRYWTLRGGHDYFREQEGQVARGLRVEWIAERLVRYRPRSLLEIGCGYGKLLRELRIRLDIPLVGIDFSPTQLAQAREYLVGSPGVQLIHCRGERLPFSDGFFDMVVTSAVILHNPPEAAEQMRREVMRVARRFAAHNEETNESYNRYGYDTAAWYERHHVELMECGPIPMDSDPATSQFCVARVGTEESDKGCSAEGRAAD
jgi:SAM-dependent methyltransferase